MRSLLSIPRRRITARITLVFVGLIAIMTLLGVIAMRTMIKRDLEEGTRHDMQRAMDRVADDLRQARQQVFLLSQVAARATHVEEQMPDSGTSTLQITLVEEARSRGIEVGVYSAEDAAAPAWAFLRRGLDGVPTVDYVTLGEGPGRLHVVAVSPIGFPEAGRRVVTASLSLGRDFLQHERMDLGGDVTIFTRGEMVATSQADTPCIEAMRKVLFSADNWRLLDEGKRLYFTFDCRSEAKAALAFPVSTYDGRTVVLAIARSRASEQKALMHTTLGIAGGSGVAVLAVCAAFYVLMSRAIAPLKALTRLSGSISEGRYGETVPVHGEDEVAELGAAFNRMSVSLKKAGDELSDWNRTLERRVEEKSEELERIHRRMIEVEKLAAMGQLAAGVAHEINNPLSGILGYAEIAIQLYGSRPPGTISPDEAGRMVTYFRNIEGLSQRCRAIILDMLRFARHHAEDDMPLHVNEIIREMVVFLDKQITGDGVTVSERYDPELPFIRGNGVQLQQVFTNLILNAVQAMPGGGILAVSTRRAGPFVEAELSDTGVGIDPGHLHRIFEPFFTTKPVGEGTGLGLSVSYGIVKRHGGDIRVTSEPGKGSTFTVSLPIDGASA